MLFLFKLERTMKRSIAVLLFIFSISNLLAQDDYVILAKGDSLTGKASLLQPGELHDELQIKSGKKKQRFKAFQVKRAYIKGKMYHPIRLDGIYKYMLLEKKGYASIYRYRPEQSYEFTAQYLSKVDGGGADVPNFTFKKTVGDFVSDCPEVLRKVNERTYRRSNLEEMVDAYNECITSGDVYKHSVIKKNAEDSGGIALLDIIINKAEQSDANEELTTLLGDIKTKLENGDSIPKYLISALKDQSSELPEIKTEITEFIKKISKQKK